MVTLANSHGSVFAESGPKFSTLPFWASKELTACKRERDANRYNFILAKNVTLYDGDRRNDKCIKFSTFHSVFGI